MKGETRKRLERLEGRAVEDDTVVEFTTIYQDRDGNEVDRYSYFSRVIQNHGANVAKIRKTLADGGKPTIIIKSSRA